MSAFRITAALDVPRPPNALEHAILRPELTIRWIKLIVSLFKCEPCYV